jgi:hypothetical protein
LELGVEGRARLSAIGEPLELGPQVSQRRVDAAGSAFLRELREFACIRVRQPRRNVRVSILDIDRNEIGIG